MSTDLITIDGSMGEGGGQILRSCLSLALCTGRPVRITNIRKARKRPGLARQHLVAVKAAAQVGRGHVEGAALGSGELTFVPTTVEAGDYAFAIGSAGSTGSKRTNYSVCSRAAPLGTVRAKDKAAGPQELSAAAKK